MLETALEEEGFQKVAEGRTKEGALVLKIPEANIPKSGDSDLKVIPDDCYLELRIVDKAEISDCAPGQEYVVFHKPKPRIKIGFEVRYEPDYFPPENT